MTRTAHPYRDLEVIDARAPRVNQAVIGSLAIVALATQTAWIVPILALQLIVGLTLGRQFCLPCLLYFEVIQPRTGEGPLEDARPPRFANQIGAALLTAATAFLVLGVPAAGWILAGAVGGLALLAATTGFCLGCWMHRRIYGACDVCDLSYSGNTTSAASMSSRSPL